MVKIYIIENLLDGKAYVGQTKKTLKARLFRHRYTTRPDMPIWVAIKRDGIKNFQIKELETVPDELANKSEEKWILAINSLIPNGYNVKSNCRWTQTMKDRLSRRLNGRIISPEWRAKISLAHKGKKMKDEQRLRMTGIQPPQFIGRKQDGDNNGNAKLNWEKVREIRRRYQEGNISQEKLSVEYMVKQAAIYKVIQKITWKEYPT